MRTGTIACGMCSVLLLAACGADDPPAQEPGGDGGTGASTPAGAGGTAATGASGAGASSSGGSGSAGGGAGGSTGGGGAGSGHSASDWIIAHFAGAEVVTGDFTTRTAVETPALVQDATGCCAKYAFDVREEEAPDVREVGFVDVAITDLETTDGFGGGILSGYAPGLVLFLSDVHITPSWPIWESYSTTNMDGMVLDDSAAIYAEDLTVEDWNADGAIDNKAPISQFVRLTIEGQGNRAMRYWGAGPHYLVESNLNNAGGAGEGSLLWFSDCSTATVKIYASTFNGSATVPEELISCDNGDSPQLEYLDTDPRTTGEMHEMFGP
jgi:hypothetical protein